MAEGVGSRTLALGPVGSVRARWALGATARQGARHRQAGVYRVLEAIFSNVTRAANESDYDWRLDGVGDHDGAGADS